MLLVLLCICASGSFAPSNRNLKSQTDCSLLTQVPNHQRTYQPTHLCVCVRLCVSVRLHGSGYVCVNLCVSALGCLSGRQVLKKLSFCHIKITVSLSALWHIRQ